MKRTYSKYTKDAILSVVSDCTSASDVVRKITGNNHPRGESVFIVNNRIKEFGIDASHFHWVKNIGGRNKPRSKEEFSGHFLKKDSPFILSSLLKKKLIGFGMIQNKCSVCGLSGEWQGKPITLQLDHVNGDRNDNRLENLDLKCPNCHSQTVTFTGKNKRKVAPAAANRLEIGR